METYYSFSAFAKKRCYEGETAMEKNIWDGTILIEERADPYILLAEDGNYYFTASYPVRGREEHKNGIGYDRIVLRCADTIEGLKTAEEVTIWHEKDSKKVNRFIWAPELHKIGDSYYILFTGSVDVNNVWSIRPHMLKCVGENLMDPKSWRTEDESNLYRVTAKDDFSFTDFSLDMTCFENRGHWYVIWAQKGTNLLSNLYLAEMDEKKPWELISKPVLLSMPEYDWEMRGGVKVDEGPSVLKHKDKIFVSFSASATDYNYCIGMLEADCNANLLEQKSWKKYDHPFLTSEDLVEQCGPGHNSFTKDADENDILVYHARPFACSNGQDGKGHYGKCEYVNPGEDPLMDPCRHARIKKLHFDEQGVPVLNKRETNGGYLFVSFTDGREDGEQVYFAISRDGLHFKDLNGGNPILVSDIGEMGVRDPFLIRDVHHPSHFYLIATDLRIANGKGWEAAQYAGSRKMLIWESEDLLHWSRVRSVEIGVEGAGCVWAPEAIYDKKRDAYLVFFASMVEKKQRIYAAYTTDFKAFSKPKIYIERDNHVIDTTIIFDGEWYYRFSKDESKKVIIIERGDDLMGDFEEISSKTLKNLYGVEGPECFYLTSQGKWCLIVDRFMEQLGYLPILCENLTEGELSIMKEGSYDFGTLKKRHGGVLAITEEEYIRLLM